MNKTALKQGKVKTYKRPFFSVILTTYNRKELLKRALNSVFKQTFGAWEVIISDDGGTDDSLKEVLGLIAGNDRVKYVYHSHVGSGGSKNIGIAQAAGDYITFLDDDDEYHPSHLLSRAEVLENNPGIDFLHGGVKVVGDRYVPDINNLSKQIPINKVVLGGTFVVRRSAINEIGGFTETGYGEDADFFKKCKMHGLRMRKIGKKTYIYNRHSNSITGKIRLAAKASKKLKIPVI